MRAGAGKYLAVLIAALAAFAMTLLAVVQPAAAQQAPEVPEPVAAVVAPVFDEVSPCGNISLALAAGDLVLRAVTDAVGGAPGPVADLVANAYGQALLALTKADVAPCTLVPPAQLDTKCGVDNQLAGAIGGLPVPSGLPLPVDPIGLLPVSSSPAFVGMLVQALAAAGSDQLAGPLDCKTTKRAAGGGIPAIGSAGVGGVDLTRPAMSGSDDDGIGAAADGGGKAARSRSSRLPGQSSTSEVASETGSAAANPAVTGALASPKVASSTVQPLSDTRRNGYRALAFLLAGLAAWGFISPRKKPA